MERLLDDAVQVGGHRRWELRQLLGSIEGDVHPGRPRVARAVLADGAEEAQRRQGCRDEGGGRPAHLLQGLVEVVLDLGGVLGGEARATDHIMLVGEGAAKFAREMGYPTEDLMVEESRIAWLVWKRSMRDKSGQTHWSGEFYARPGAVAALREQFPGVEENTLAWAMHVATHPPKGTINCLALNAKGEMSGTTTTSGMAWKIAGRVGDSPIIGAGVYVDQDVGAAGSTGRGEENIRIAGRIHRGKYAARNVAEGRVFGCGEALPDQAAPQDHT